MKSENIGGLVSMAGSALFLLGGDASGIAVALSFLIAEIVLARHGHKPVGYSIGCTLFALGDLLAVTSELASNNPSFQYLLIAMAVTWFVGSLRAPLMWLGRRRNHDYIVRLADALQPLSGIGTLALRLPGIWAAIGGGSYLGAAAVACWAVADVLVGRVHQSYAILSAAFIGWRSR
jgi:hypothetical protein